MAGATSLDQLAQSTTARRLGLGEYAMKKPDTASAP